MKALWVALVLFGIGFSAWLVLDTDQRTDLSPTEAGFALDAQRGGLDLQYVTGEPLDVARLRLHIEHDGQTQELQGTSLGLGRTWQVGDVVCVVGPGCILEAAREVTVIVGYDDTAVFRGTRTL